VIRVVVQGNGSLTAGPDVVAFNQSCRMIQRTHTGSFKQSM
jgi:hypothetical protein